MAERERRAADWLTVGDALHRILNGVQPQPAELVPLLEALGRTLAVPVESPIDQPPWNNSAMDGFAVRSEDVRGATAEAPVQLRIVEEVPAGSFANRAVRRGEAIRIMTGAPIPEGADSVVRIEHTDAWAGHPSHRKRYAAGGATEVVLVASDLDAGRNIRARGEDVRAGDRVLDAGRVVRAAEIGVLATIGQSAVRVHRRPRVGILSNGNELAELTEFEDVRSGRRIVNSNSYSLAGAVQAAACTPVLLGIARDDADSIRTHVERAAGLDVLITTAGASVGDHDLLKDVLEEAGLRIDFWRVRMRPGSPFSFGHLGTVPVFGLPGNPVSALVTFEVLVRPALRRMLGRTEVHPPALAVRSADRIESKAGLTHFLRVRLTAEGDGEWWARLTGPQGSGILTSVAEADALLVVPEDAESIEAGAMARAIPLPVADPAWGAPGY